MKGRYITEYCGAIWHVSVTGDLDSHVPDPRAIWVALYKGKSECKPHVVGFYAPSIKSAEKQLNAEHPRYVIDGYNVEFLAARSPRWTEEY